MNESKWHSSQCSTISVQFRYSPRARVTRIALCLLAFVLVMALPAMAQFSAGVQGIVQDPSGAVIGNASVTLTNVDTRITATTTSNGRGVYQFASLGPGNYQVAAEASGFAPTRTSFILMAGEMRNVPLLLAVGTAASTVTVTSESPLFDTAETRNLLTLDAADVSSLPLLTLNPTALIPLTPGVEGLGSGTSTNFTIENSIDASANGRGPNDNQYIINGLDIVDPGRPGRLNLTPDADTIAEVTSQTNTYAVDYGRVSSMQVVMTTKSGTDHWHGFGSENYTYQGLQARGEFGIAQPAKVAPYHTNNMSFGGGGPIIPNHRLFVFAGYEPYLSLSSNGGSVQVYEDPAFVTFAQQAKPNSPEVQMLAKYPASREVFRNVSQTAQQVFGASNPAANTGCDTPSTDNIPCGTPVFDQGNFNFSNYTNGYQYSTRIDKDFNKDRLYGLIYGGALNWNVTTARPAFDAVDRETSRSFQLSETHTFSSNLLNEAFGGQTHDEGIEPVSALWTNPVVSVTGLGVGFGSRGTNVWVDNDANWRDILTWTKGSHIVKAGYEGDRQSITSLTAPYYAVPVLTYKSMMDLVNDNPYSETDISYDLVTGNLRAHNLGYGIMIGGAFVEDTWKVSRKLTLNYGIRYDNFGNGYPSLSGTVMTNYHLGSGTTFQEQMANGALTQQSDLLSHDMNWIFSPRVGFAYSPFTSSKWVLHGGFGIYRDYLLAGNVQGNVQNNPPGFVVPTFYNNGSTAAPIFSYGKQDSYPFGFSYPEVKGQPLNSKGGVVGSQVAIGGYSDDLTAPHTLNWSLAAEREITRGLVAAVTYVGSHSGNLITGSGNTANYGFNADMNAYAGDLLQHPIFKSGNFTGSETQTRLNTSFGGINYGFNSEVANYNGVIASVQGRFARQGSLIASYMHSKSMDDAQQGYPTGYPSKQLYYAPSPWDVAHRFSLGAHYELPGSDLNNAILRRVVGGWSLGAMALLQSGAPFTVTTNAALKLSTKAADGQALTSANFATELAAGSVQFAPGSGDFNADGNNTDYPSVTSYAQKHKRSDYKIGNGIFPICSGGVLPCGDFALPSVGQEGNEKPYQFRNPGYANVDFRLKKTVAIRESTNLEFHFDMFNAFNRVNLNGVGSNLATGSTFGQSSSTYPARNILLGARINF